MVPVAWACRAGGHEVLVASQPELTDAIALTGLPAAPVGRDVDAEAIFRDIVLAPPSAQRPQGGGGPRVLNLLVQLAEAMTDDLIELAAGWRADLVVFEPTAFAGPLAAAALRIPAVARSARWPKSGAWMPSTRSVWRAWTHALTGCRCPWPPAGFRCGTWRTTARACYRRSSRRDPAARGCVSPGAPP